jgi:hypothetical protein
LLGGVLPAIYSGADQLKRQVYGLLTNPQEQAQRAAQSLLQSRADRQALMARTFANPERPFQVTDQAGLSQLTDQVMSGELGFAPAGITAFHGTPHNILGKFDINKVGTGEGNQTFGYGMYFAENPAVAKQYQAALSDTKYFADGKQLKGNDAWAAQFLHDFQDDALPKKVDVNTAVAKANEILKSGEAREEIVNKIKQLDKTGVSVESGNLYKVDIPDEYVPKMLDWDKPLTEQPKQVQEGLKKLGIETDINKLNEYDDALLKSLFEDSNIALPKQPINPTGQEIYERFIQGNPKYTAEKLKEVGITGIRYLDEGSRGNYKARTTYKGEPYGEVISFKTKNQLDDYIKQKKEEGFGVETFPQTSNFVVFDPTDVKILERNNEPLEGLLD